VESGVISGCYIAVLRRTSPYTALIVGFRCFAIDPMSVTDAETNSPGRPALLTATPSVERVGRWLRTLALLAGVLGLLVGLFALELVVRL